MELMKNTYILFLILMLIFSGLGLQGQTIKLSFNNAENTNDGVHDYYEVDVMIQTLDGMADFKLGAGQFYINYNPAAFGENIYNDVNQENDGIDITFPHNGTPEGYIIGQSIDFTEGFKIYGTIQLNNNTNFRLSYSHQQIFSSGTFNENNTTELEAKLLHLKIRYIDVSQDPMVVFEDDESVLNMARDQFFTACGPSITSDSNTAICATYPGIKIEDAVFDNNGATLSVRDSELENQITIYPNPTSNYIKILTTNKIKSVEIFDISGKKVKHVLNSNEISVNQIQAGIYIVKVFTDKGKVTKKIVIE